MPRGTSSTRKAAASASTPDGRSCTLSMVARTGAFDGCVSLSLSGVPLASSSRTLMLDFSSLSALPALHPHAWRRFSCYSDRTHFAGSSCFSINLDRSSRAQAFATRYRVYLLSTGPSVQRLPSFYVCSWKLVGYWMLLGIRSCTSRSSFPILSCSVSKLTWLTLSLIFVGRWIALSCRRQPRSMSGRLWSVHPFRDPIYLESARPFRKDER
jgi:hypothetical protein